MALITLTDLGRNLWTDHHAIYPLDLGIQTNEAWSITKRTLQGGRRAGVEMVRLCNGALSVEIIPTRGMGLWRGQYLGDPLGWQSPILDGPIHPSFVNQAGLGGFGWLEGFDELLARCGLEHVGPPFQDGPFLHTLHGKIQNTPAHQLTVEVTEEPPHQLIVTGTVDETRIFGPQLRLEARYSTTPGSDSLQVRDTITNLGDSPARVSLLYHWNIGPPYLEEGSRVLVPSRIVAPQTPRAAEGFRHYDRYGPPEPGFGEQVYHFEPIGGEENSASLAVLRNNSGEKAVGIRYQTNQLPYFAVWKNTRGLKEGYVTGLEPSTNFPNPRPFEQQHNRFVELLPGHSYQIDQTFQVASGSAQVALLEAEVARLQAGVVPQVLEQPVEPYAPSP